jgi:hypothetical protein
VCVTLTLLYYNHFVLCSRGDAFLEPYMQGGLGPALTPRESPLLHLDGDTEEDEASSPPHATIQSVAAPDPAVLASKFRLIELRGASTGDLKAASLQVNDAIYSIRVSLLYTLVF